MKFSNLLSTLAAAAAVAVSSQANAAVINTNTIANSVIVTGANSLEFVYGSVTSPNAPCCGVQVTLTQGFRLPTAAELVAGFGTLTGLLGAFNLLDNDQSNNIVAFQYFNSLDVNPTGDVGDVRAGFINNLDMGTAFYDYAGSQFRIHDNSEFFFVRDQQTGNVPEPTSLALIGLALAGLVVTRKAR